MQLPLKYHRATAQLLTEALVASDSVPQFASLGPFTQHVPASVQEWYGLRDAVSILHRHSNCDHALEPHEFDSRIDSGNPIVRFMIENQGCAAWGFLVDSNVDDPPVVVNQQPDWWHRPQWEFCTERFSEFVYLKVFDYQYLVRQWENPGECEDEFHGQSASLPPHVIRELCACFEPVQSSCDWPEVIVKRFQQKQEKRIVIQESDGTAQWLILASSRDGRRELVQQVINVCDKVGFEFHPPHIA